VPEQNDVYITVFLVQSIIYDRLSITVRIHWLARACGPYPQIGVPSFLVCAIIVSKLCPVNENPTTLYSMNSKRFP